MTGRGGAVAADLLWEGCCGGLAVAPGLEGASWGQAGPPTRAGPAYIWVIGLAVDAELGACM